MNLEERYKAAGENSYVGRVRANQVGISSNGEDVNTLTDGVDFFDGVPRDRENPLDDAYQKELKRNAPRSFKYNTPGQNGKVPGADNSVSGTGGLSRWTTSALNIGFKDSQARPSKDSIYKRFKAFKGNSTWTGRSSFHLYNPVEAAAQYRTNTALSSDARDLRIGGSPSGPSPAGLQG